MRLEVLVDILDSLEGLWRVVLVAYEFAASVLDSGAVVILAVLDAVKEFYTHLQNRRLRFLSETFPSRIENKTMNLSGWLYDDEFVNIF